MSHPEASDSHLSKWVEDCASLEGDGEVVRLSAARARAMEEAGAEIARQLNGPMTALLLYMGEIKQNSHQLSQAAGNRIYLKQGGENALQQTERVCPMVKQMADPREGPPAAACRKPGPESRTGH